MHHLASIERRAETAAPVHGEWMERTGARRVDREVVDALLRTSVSRKGPAELFGDAADLFQRLGEIDVPIRHRVADYFAVVWMYLPVDRSITVSAPQRMAHNELLDLLLDAEVTASCHVGVHQEMAIAIGSSTLPDD